MFHLIHGKIKTHHHLLYLENDYFGIEVIYTGKAKKGTFFLYPRMDQTSQTIKYYAFDKAEQKQHFTQLIKIQGIGGKSGYHLAMIPHNDLSAAVEAMDMKFFQKLPGIGPKTAKRILLEMRQSITSLDLDKLEMDEALYKDIISSLKSLGYEATKVKKLLPSCPLPLKKQKLPDIMKRLIDHL